MKLWTIGILLFVGSCASSNDGYEIKRFHIQSRQLDGEPQCIVTRRKRSTREADYIKKIDAQVSSSDHQAVIPAEQASKMDELTVGDYPAEIVIKKSDLIKSSGILIVPNPSSPNVPLVFAVRPVLGNSNNNKYLKMQIFDDSSFSAADGSNDDNDDDDDINQDFRDISIEVNDDDFEDYSEDTIDPPKWQAQASKKTKRKQLVRSQIEESDEADSLLSYNEKRKKQSIKRKENLRKLMIRVLEDQLSTQNKKTENYKKIIQDLKNVQNIDYERSLSLSPSANCIIIEKETDFQPTGSERSSEGLLGLDSSGGRLPNKSYGLRKRYKGKRRQI